MNGPLALTVPPYTVQYWNLHRRTVPLRVVRQTSEAGILSPARGFMSGFDLTMQTQVGCPGGCVYCYVPESSRLAPADVRDQWGFLVRDKRDVESKLRRHLARGELAEKAIYWSGVTDPYAGAPEITRAIWKTLVCAPQYQRPRRIAVQTRFRVDRDLDAIRAYCHSGPSRDGGPQVVASVSVGTDREDLIRAWERATPTFARRVEAIRRLCAAGIFVVATLSPLGPWRDFNGSVRHLRDIGVRYLSVLFFKQRGPARTPRAFLDYLAREYPQLLDPSWQQERINDARDVFGANRVLVGQEGFASLAAPHCVGCRGDRADGPSAIACSLPPR